MSVIPKRDPELTKTHKFIAKGVRIGNARTILAYLEYIDAKEDVGYLLNVVAHDMLATDPDFKKWYAVNPNAGALVTAKRTKSRRSPALAIAR
jgi:hypothetical protein